MSRYCILYSTHPSPAQARATARALVKDKLATCCNILPAIESHYRWQGKIEKGREVALISKTTKARAASAIRAIKALHPYENPAILELPVTGGSAPFLRWIAAGVKR